MLVPAVMVVMSLVYALAAYLRGRCCPTKASRPRIRSAVVDPWNCRNRPRKLAPIRRGGGGGYIGPGPCSFGEQAQPMIYFSLPTNNYGRACLVTASPLLALICVCRDDL